VQSVYRHYKCSKECGDPETAAYQHPLCIQTMFAAHAWVNSGTQTIEGTKAHRDHPDAQWNSVG
jgi:hypothetical protein